MDARRPSRTRESRRRPWGPQASGIHPLSRRPRYAIERARCRSRSPSGRVKSRPDSLLRTCERSPAVSSTGRRVAIAIPLLQSTAGSLGRGGPPYMKKLILSVFIFTFGFATATHAQQVNTLLTKQPPEVPGKEIKVITVNYAPGAVDAIHRHDAHAVVYVLDGEVEMQVRGGTLSRLGPGQVFYEYISFLLLKAK